MKWSICTSYFPIYESMFYIKLVPGGFHGPVSCFTRSFAWKGPGLGFHALLSLSWNSSSFLKEGPHIFISPGVLQIPWPVPCQSCEMLQQRMQVLWDHTLGELLPSLSLFLKLPTTPPRSRDSGRTELHLTQRFPNLFEPHNFCFYFCWRLQSQWYSQGGLLVYFLEIEGIVLCILQKRPSSSPENVNSFTLSNFPRHRTAPKLFLNNNN